MKIVVLLSGGVDSTVLAYHLQNQGHELHCLFVGYSQITAIVERHYAAYHAAMIDAEFADASVDLNWASNALTGRGRGVVVPMRNLTLLSVAASYAISVEADAIGFAAIANDRRLFPDCGPEFVHSAEKAIQWAYPRARLQIEDPFISMEKWQVVKRGLELGVDVHRTWSCYAPGPKPCGECLSCKERDAAFHAAGLG